MEFTLEVGRIKNGAHGFDIKIMQLRAEATQSTYILKIHYYPYITEIRTLLNMHYNTGT